MNTSILQIVIELAKKICQQAEEGEIRDLDVMAEEILKDCKGTSGEERRKNARCLTAVSVKRNRRSRSR